MTIRLARLWLLTGLNGAAALALVLFALQKIPATMYWVSDGVAVMTVMVASALVPVGAAAVVVLKRWAPEPPSRRRRVYGRSSAVFLTVAWLCLLPVSVFWGAIFVHIWEPWPLSLAQGPDTQRARDGFERVLGFAPDASVHEIYYRAYAVRDRSDFLRFGYADAMLLERIGRQFDLVELPPDDRALRRVTFLGEDDTHGSWWTPAMTSAAPTVYVDRRTRDYLVALPSPSTHLGAMHILWVDEAHHVAYYAHHSF